MNQAIAENEKIVEVLLLENGPYDLFRRYG